MGLLSKPQKFEVKSPFEYIHIYKWKKKLCFLRKKLTAFIKVYISFTTRASDTNLSIPSSRTRIIFSTKRWKNFCGLILWEEIECNEFFFNFFLLNLLDLLSLDNGKLTCLYSKLFLWLQSFSVMNVQKKKLKKVYLQKVSGLTKSQKFYT